MKSPLRDTASSTPAPSRIFVAATAQPWQSSSLLSTRDLALSVVDDVVNSIAQVVLYARSVNRMERVRFRSA